MSPQPTPRQIEINQLYHELGSAGAVAKKLGVAKSGVIKNLFYGARNGLHVTPDGYSPVAPAGWSSTFKTVQYNGKGEVIQTWDRVRPDEETAEQFWAFLDQRTPVLNCIIPPPENVNENLMLEWLLMDHHLGMYAWAEETGSDYDLQIARELITRAAQKIFSQHGNVQKAIIVLGGDNLHADNRSAQTEKSKHHLDVDSRYPKSADYIEETMTTAIEIALSRANEVEVVVLSGNHDYHSAIWLARVLRAYYRKNPRVTVNTSPEKHKFSRFGSTYFMYTHGDTGNNNRLSSYLMNHIIKEGLQGIDRMYVRKGHLHKRGRNVPPGLTEEDGVVVELFPTLCAPDSYAHEQAYQSARATVANIWHRKYGQRSRMELGVAELMEETA